MTILRIKKLNLYLICLGILFAVLALPNLIFLIRSNLTIGKVVGTEMAFAGYNKRGVEKREPRAVIHFFDNEGQEWSFLSTPLSGGSVGLEGSTVHVRYIYNGNMDARVDHPGSIWKTSLIWGVPLFMIITVLFLHQEFLPKTITFDFKSIEEQLFGQSKV